MLSLVIDLITKDEAISAVLKARTLTTLTLENLGG
jgi:hypothetical protein